MKTKIFILIALLAGLTLQMNAQTKRAKKTAKKTTTVKKKPVKTAATTSYQAEVKTETKEEAAPVKKVSATTTTKRSAATSDTYYKTAVGLKFLYGISLTGKFFIADNRAIEALIRYRKYSGLGTEFNVTALYEFHGDISGASGLRWYAGGGGYAGFFSYEDNAIVEGSSSSTFGVSGVLGLEYKIKNLPLAISADWQPVYIVNGNSGFAADNGGFGIKYTF